MRSRTGPRRWYDARMGANPWSKFSVGEPSAHAKWTNPDCQPLVRVSHVAHVPIAIRIAEDARLRADLVYDKSKLNKERIRVVWLSPNDWDGAGGSRYGNIRFDFDWPTLVDGKRAFWVESIAYGIEACRILITDVDYSSLLVPYDPTVGDGPWWIDSTGQQHWNGNYCLEIMVEGDISLTGAKHVDFVKHHPKRCNIDYTACAYCGCDSDKAGAEFLARIASSAPRICLPGLTQPHKKGLGPSISVYSAINRLSARLSKLKPSNPGTVSAADTQAPALARALLRALAINDLASERAELAGLFISIDEADLAIRALLAATVGLPNAAALDII